MICTTPTFYLCRRDTLAIRLADDALQYGVADLIAQVVGGFIQLPVKAAPLTPRLKGLGRTEREQVFAVLSLAAHCTAIGDNPEHSWLSETPKGLLNRPDEHTRRAIGSMMGAGALRHIKTATVSPTSKHSFERTYVSPVWGIAWNACYVSNPSILAAFLHQRYAWRSFPDALPAGQVLFCASKADLNTIRKTPRIPDAPWGWRTMMPEPPEPLQIKKANT